MSYNYAVLGAGRQGTAAAYDMARWGDARRIILADYDIEIARNAAQRVNTQIGGEAYKPSATASLYFYTKLAVSEAEQSDLFIGLTITDTAVLTNLGKRIGFRSVDGSAALGFEYEGTAETTIEGVHTLVNDTEVELEFFWDHVNSQVRVYIDGTLKGTYTPGANLPDTEIKPSVNFLTGAGSAETCTISRLKVIQTSGR